MSVCLKQNIPLAPGAADHNVAWINLLDHPPPTEQKRDSESELVVLDCSLLQSNWKWLLLQEERKILIHKYKSSGKTVPRYTFIPRIFNTNGGS